MQTDTPFIKRYAIRRVNPFLGVLQVIETESGRASTANGIVWDIEVKGERPRGWGSLNRHQNRTGYYRFGLWSAEEGLAKRPLAPHLDSDPLNQSGQRLIECIQSQLDQVPFKLADTHELWLFDSDNRSPIALLASSIIDKPPPSPEPKKWSACIGADGVPSQRRFPESAELEAQVKQRAGFNLNKYWVIRESDGRGIIQQTDARVSAEAFPPYLITQHWSDNVQRKRVEAFIDWTAPSLLTLQQLNREQRQRLEQQLNIQAQSIEHHWHLYPEIIDEKCLRAAIVQCRIQKASQP